jgi:DNA invertase Pin-like site-specific DNA recombinase
MDRIHRGVAIRRRAFAREQAIRKALAAREKQEYIASKLSISLSLVRKIANRIHKEKHDIQSRKRPSG